LSSPLVWAEIDLGNIAHNTRQLRGMLDRRSQLLVAVKANAYGHGAVQIAQKVLQSGASTLGVARIEEAIELRNAGIDAPILIFGYTDPVHTEQLMAFHLIQTVYSLPMAEAFSKAAVLSGGKISVHLKVDTGMGRIGLIPDCAGICLPGMDVKNTAIQHAQAIASLSGIELEGIYTHFAAADNADKTSARNQLSLFLDYVDRLARSGVRIPLRHAANSAAIIEMPETHLDMVRAGISIYGFYPSRETDRKKIDLLPAMTLKTRIVQLKSVSSHFKVSYGRTYETVTPTTIATVPVGYADGLNRRLSSRGHMLVQGQRAPIIGRICMDFTMLDVGEIDGASLNDEVIVFGKQKDASITADDIAETLDTIHYEIVTAISNRVPRMYKRVAG